MTVTDETHAELSRLRELSNEQRATIMRLEERDVTHSKRWAALKLIAATTAGGYVSNEYEDGRRNYAEDVIEKMTELEKES